MSIVVSKSVDVGTYGEVSTYAIYRNGWKHTDCSAEAAFPNDVHTLNSVKVKVC